MYRAIVIGASAGGLYAIRDLLVPLPSDFRIPIIIVQHLSPTSENYMVEFLNKNTSLNIKEVDEKEPIKPNMVYIAPPNYHVLIEEDETFTLSADEKVNYSRPSIDVLFYSAADIYRKDLIGVVLTGANDDGARGLFTIRKNGGLGIVQTPSSAEAPQMPSAAILEANPEYIIEISEIAKLLIEMNKRSD
ncbi:MAG: chemotaxis protein CheB [Marinilabiliales bacterium]|nr:MAG: chemotaxis protein CheB [Marinilabiliales bacterium]